jgi:hypothetical protein
MPHLIGVICFAIRIIEIEGLSRDNMTNVFWQAERNSTLTFGINCLLSLIDTRKPTICDHIIRFDSLYRFDVSMALFRAG